MGIKEQYAGRLDFFNKNAFGCFKCIWLSELAKSLDLFHVYCIIDLQGLVKK